jgi:hypothetical protein
MKKIIYLLSLFLGLGLCIYFYFINFDNMSETMLVNSVLYWYVPVIFGLYGLTALRISKTIDVSSDSTIKHLFSWEDSLMNVLLIALFILGGLVGILLFFIPLAIFKPKSRNFDIYVSILGSVVWLVILFAFFVILWPSL